MPPVTEPAQPTDNYGAEPQPVESRANDTDAPEFVFIHHC